MRNHNTIAPVVTGDVKLCTMARLPLFAGCSGKQLVELGRLFDSSLVAAGVTCERSATSSRWLFVLLEGVAGSGSTDGTARVLGPGECWGRLASDDGTPWVDSTRTLTALTALTLLSLDRRSYAALERGYPKIAAQLRQSAEWARQTEDEMTRPLSMVPARVGVA
jgi:hypothetical protein